MFGISQLFPAIPAYCELRSPLVTRSVVTHARAHTRARARARRVKDDSYSPKILSKHSRGDTERQLKYARIGGNQAETQTTNLANTDLTT